MNTKDTSLIWESYVSENRGSSKYDDVQAQLQDLIRQKTEYYADIDPRSAFDVSVEDLESQYSEAGDSEAIAILNDISAKNSLKEEGTGKTAVYVLSDSHGVYGVYTSPDKWKAARAAHGPGSVMEPEQIFIDSAPLDLS